MIQSDEKLNGKFGKVNVEQKARHFLAKVNKDRGRRFANRHQEIDDELKPLDLGATTLADPSTNAAVYITVRKQQLIDDEDSKKKLPNLKKREKKAKNDDVGKNEMDGGPMLLTNLLEQDRMIMMPSKSSSKNIFSHNNLNQPIYLSPAKIEYGPITNTRVHQSEEDFLKSKLHIRRKPVKLKPLIMSMPEKLTTEASETAAVSRSFQAPDHPLPTLKDTQKPTKHARKCDAAPFVPYLVFKNLNEENLLGLQTPAVDSDEYENMQIRRRNGGKMPENKAQQNALLANNRTLLAKKLINLKLNDNLNAKPAVVETPKQAAKKAVKLAQLEPVEMDRENQEGEDYSGYNSWPNEQKYYEQKNNPIRKEIPAKPDNPDVNLKRLAGKFKAHDYNSIKCAEWLTKHVFKYYDRDRKMSEDNPEIAAAYWK